MKAYLYFGTKIVGCKWRHMNNHTKYIKIETINIQPFILFTSWYSPIIIWTMDTFSSPWSTFFVKYQRHCHSNSNITLMGSKYYESVTFSHSNVITIWYLFTSGWFAWGNIHTLGCPGLQRDNLIAILLWHLII